MRHVARRSGVVVVMACLAYYLMPLRLIRAADEWVRGSVGVVATGVLCALFVRQLRRQLRAGSRDEVRAESLILLMVLALFGFSLSYFLIADDPGQFVDLRTRTDALYFTLSTLATVGYGDVHAAGQAARIVVSMQIAFNVLFVSTAASLIGTAAKRRRDPS